MTEPEELEKVATLENAISVFEEAIQNDKIRREECERLITDASRESERIAFRLERRESRLRELKDRLLEMYRGNRSHR